MRTALPMMKIAFLIATVLGLGLGLGGCVKQDTYDSLFEANRALTARNQELMEQNRQLQTSMDSLTGRVGAGDRTLGEASMTNAQLRAELDSLRSKLAAMDGNLANIQFGPLDSATDAALEDLARRYPGLLTYDASRGMLRFNADITFASGSFELTGQGTQSIQELARLLQTVPSAAQYDLVVVGHTDSQRVRQVAGRRFANNDELSAFRAISVHNSLIGGGLGKNKVMFAGGSRQSPRTANAGNGNTPQNRRVEVYLVKSTLGDAGAAGNAARSAPARAAPAANNPDIMK